MSASPNLAAMFIRQHKRLERDSGAPVYLRKRLGAASTTNLDEGVYAYGETQAVLVRTVSKVNEDVMRELGLDQRYHLAITYRLELYPTLFVVTDRIIWDGRTFDIELVNSNLPVGVGGKDVRGILGCWEKTSSGALNA